MANTQFNASPVPIDAGLSFTDRTRERTFAFAPLSFIYLVYNENNFRDTPVKNQSMIAKVSFLKQF